MISCGVFLSFVLTVISFVDGRRLCVSLDEDLPSLYSANRNGHQGRLSRLVDHLSNVVTSDAIISLLSESQSHSSLTCHGEDFWERMASEHHSCSHQVAHHIECEGREDEQRICGWMRIFLDTCTSQVLSRCFTEEAILFIRNAVEEAIENSDEGNNLQCSNAVSRSRSESPIILRSLSQRRSLEGGPVSPFRNLIQSKMLRLG